MTLALNAPSVDELAGTVAALRSWQRDGAPVQLHPGDVGWAWQAGVSALASNLRVWARDGRIVAVGLLDAANLLRVGISPDANDDRELARRMANDVADPSRGVLPEGRIMLEARFGDAFRAELTEHGWQADEPWAPLVRGLTPAVEDGGLRIERVDSASVADRVAVQRAAFDGSRFSAERWRAMAAGPAYVDARCLVGYDEHDTAVAMATVWSAGAGRPGLLEPLGVHRDHRGRGHGRAITLAAAAALRTLGASSATVCTPASNAAAVAAYASAGFERTPDVADFRLER